MNTLWKSLVKRLREYLYLLVTFPVALILFVIVMAATSSNTFLPLGILLMLGLLTFMQWVAAFEVKRTNRLLKTDFAVVDNWFSKPFFSWDGAKERVTSLRSWMAIVYIFIAFGWSIFSFVLVVVGISGLLAILTVAGVLAMSTINKSFVIIDDGDRFTGSRGFSTRYDGPFDMRMDQRGATTASHVIESFSEAELHKMFEQYGEVTNSKTLAKHIATQRKHVKLNTVQDFKTFIAPVVKGNPNKYWAQVFQAHKDNN